MGLTGEQSTHNVKPFAISPGLAAFFGTLALLALLRIAMSYLLVPEAIAMPVSLLITIVFVALPVLALFRAGSHPWTGRLAMGFVVAGGVIQFLLPLLIPRGGGFLPILLSAIAQQGLPMWTVGLGAGLALLLKDKNMLLPVAIFLALFDIFLVFTPLGFVQQLMKSQPKLLPAVAHQIPQVATQPQETGVPVGTFAYIGPADFLFMGMFFVAVFRFGMRSRETLRWLLIALALYIPLALFLGPIPLLVPIGLAVLLVNLREFKMNTEEKLSTAIVAAIGIGIIVWSATRPKPVAPPEPLPQEAGQGLPESEGSPLQGLPDQRRWPLDQKPPDAPGSTPDRP